MEIANQLNIEQFDLDIENIDALGDFEVISLGDAMAMPETGASSGISSCNSSSCCVSTSTCQLT